MFFFLFIMNKYPSKRPKSSEKVQSIQCWDLGTLLIKLLNYKFCIMEVK